MEKNRTKILSTLLFFVLFSIQCHGFQTSVKPTPALHSLEQILAYEKQITEKTSLEERIPIGVELVQATRSLGLDSMAAIYCYDLALDYYDLDSLRPALYYLNIGYDYREALGDQKTVAWISNLIGIIYSVIGDNEKALYYYFQAIEVLKEVAPQLVTYPLGNISEIYYNIGEVENAITYTREASIYSKQLSGFEYLYNHGYDCCRLSSWYHELGQQDSARYFLSISLQLADSLKVEDPIEEELLFFIHENASRIYLSANKFSQAQYHLQQAETFALPRQTLLLQILRGEYFLKVNQIDKLEEILTYDYTTEQDYKIKEDFLRFRIKAFQQTKQLAKAIEASKALEEMTRDKYGKDIRQFAAFSNARYENLKKEEQIKLLKKEQEVNQLTIQKQRAYQTAIGALFFLIMLGAIFLSYRYQQKSSFNSLLQEEVSRKTEELSALNEDLVAKNEELAQFNFIMSHDLKEPIHSIVSFAHLIEKEIAPEQEAKVKDYLDFVTSGSRQLYQLIEDINDYQNLEQVDYSKTTVDLNEVIRNVQNALTSFISKRGAIINYAPLPNIETAKSALFIIFKNLIENGIKYNRSEVPSIEVLHRETPTHHQFLVKDNGIGIEEKYFDQVFVMFKRLHLRKEFEGSGIGLAISQKVAKRIGGKIEVLASSADSGTTFMLSIRK